jgi:mannitol-1-phosphate 5-dehydrogenase
VKQAVHFGAGNIGRGFIGLLLNQSGYHVTFLDVSESLINHLKAHRKYTVELVGDTVTQILVDDVDALHSVHDAQAVTQVLLQADLITTAVGPSILPIVARQLVPVFETQALYKVNRLVNVIACENTIGGSTQIKHALMPLLSADAQAYVNTYVGFPDAAVDRIVPNQHNTDPLTVQVEPFYEWVVDAKAVKGELKIVGLHLSDKLEAYIERKLFTVNTGHATVAYIAYAKGYATIREAMADETVVDLAQGVLQETGALLSAKHGFGRDEQSAYIAKTLERFRNPHIADEAVRVARSPLRKLSANDRFIKPLRECLDLKLPTENLQKAIRYALSYDYAGDPEAVKLQELIAATGRQAALLSISGFDVYFKTIAAITD